MESSFHPSIALVIFCNALAGLFTTSLLHRAEDVRESMLAAATKTLKVPPLDPAGVDTIEGVGGKITPLHLNIRGPRPFGESVWQMGGIGFRWDDSIPMQN
ncbi:hypothetical protein [Haliea sp.]